MGICDYFMLIRKATYWQSGLWLINKTITFGIRLLWGFYSVDLFYNTIWLFNSFLFLVLFFICLITCLFWWRTIQGEKMFSKREFIKYIIHRLTCSKLNSFLQIVFVTFSLSHTMESGWSNDQIVQLIFVCLGFEFWSVCGIYTPPMTSNIPNKVIARYFYERLV